MTNEQKNTTLPEVLMLMGTQCTYCGPMMQMLMEFIKLGQIAELRLVNIENAPELASELGVRSVPWLKIGPFELTGSRTKKELQLWLQRASSLDGVSDYLVEVLSEGNIKAASKLIKGYPQALENVIDLMADPEAKINVRLGVGVIIEEMAESETFKSVIPRLLDYLSNEDARIRGDACHYLSLTKDRSYIPDIERLLADASEEVREIAQDSLDDLRE
jgi:thioredoxin-like negative regulator of GroEL